MKRLIAVVLMSFVISSCGPSPEQVQKAIEQTQVVAAEKTAKAVTNTPLPSNTPLPTNTQVPTNTQAPTNTPKPTITPTNTPTAPKVDAMQELAQKQFVDATIKDLKEMDNVKSINMVRYLDGVFEIDVRTVFNTKESLATFHLVLAKIYADFFGKATEKRLLEVLGGEKFSLKVTTCSTNGDICYQSLSEHPLLKKLYEKQISYKDWVSESNAQFVNATNTSETTSPTTEATVAPSQININPGTYLVGKDIAPGIYKGEAGGCYWERLKDLSGTTDGILANNNEEGPFYVRVKKDDYAFSTRCDMVYLDKLPTHTGEYSQTIGPGSYLVGIDIQPGTYKGNADSCYWERVKDVTGVTDDIIANDNTEGQFYVKVSKNDFAFAVNCEVTRTGD